MEDTKAIKAILLGYNDKIGELQMLELDIKEAEEIAGLKGIDYSKDPICPTNAFNSVTENEALNLYLLKERKIHLESLLQRIDTALEQLDEVERNLLVWRYKEGLRWGKIMKKINPAAEYGYKDRNTYYIHRKALENFEKKLFPNM